MQRRLQSAKFAMGLKEGNKSILEKKKKRLCTSVLAVLGSLFIKPIVDSAVQVAVMVRNPWALAKQIPKGRSGEAKIYRKNYPWVILMPEKAEPNENQGCCPCLSPLLSKPTGFSRETFLKDMGKTMVVLGRRIAQSAPAPRASLMLRKYLIWGRWLSEHKSRIKRLWKPFKSLCSISKKYCAFYLQSCQTNPSKDVVMEQKQIKMLLKICSVFC